MAEGVKGSRRGGPGAADPVAESDSSLPLWLAGGTRPDPSQPPVVCRFLATETPDDELGPPIAAVDSANRCIALGDLAPQSARQQELVCLTAAHATCPRYLRGALLEVAPRRGRRSEPISPAVLASALVLVAAIAASFGFLATRGGISVALLSPSPGPLSSQVAVLPSASATASASPGPAASESAPSTSADPRPSPEPSASPPATPSPSRTPTPPPTARPSSDRYAVLDPCPNRPSCWIYTIRSGDNLVSIAHWFGVPLDTVYELNPWTRTKGLRAGQELLLPPPTR